MSVVYLNLFYTIDSQMEGMASTYYKIIINKRLILKKNMKNYIIFFLCLNEEVHKNVKKKKKIVLYNYNYSYN